MTPNTLTGGFANAPVQSAQAFRTLLEAMARPGSIHRLDLAQPPEPLSAAAGTALLTLADGTTPILLTEGFDCPAVRDWITFHIGAPILSGSTDGALPAFACGTLESVKACLGQLYKGAPDYPDRSTTVLLELGALVNDGACLTGPGIAASTHLSLPEPAFFARNHKDFPLGFDFYLTCGAAIAGLPRSTQVEQV